MQSKTENHTMRVFYLLAIVFVVDGHTTNGHLFEMNGLFRYYSFHLMMFAFGSGYFFKLYGGARSDLAHRAKKLLVPLYLRNAVYGVGAALLGVVLLRSLKLPSMLGYLLTGTIVGPHLLGMMENNSRIRSVAEFGVVFLMFVLGLEFNLSKLRTMRRHVLGLGLLQVAATMLLATAAILGLRWLVPGLWQIPWQGALALSGVLTMSSTAIVVKLMADRMEVDSEHGKRVVGVLLFQDLTVVPLLILIPALATPGSNMATTMVLAMLKAAAVVGVLLTGGQYVMKYWLGVVARLRSDELFVLNLLLVTLGLAWLTERAGLSLALGAFIAGMLISETPFKQQVEAEIRPFHDLLLGLFFITIGMLLDWKHVFAHWQWILVLVTLPVLFKIGLMFVLTRLTGASSGVALRTAMYLAQAGEFGFVLLNLTLKGGLVPAPLFNAILASMVLTMLATPFIITYSQTLVMRLLRTEWMLQSLQVTDIARKAIAQSGHVIICGFGRSGQNLARMLAAENLAVAGGRGTALLPSAAPYSRPDGLSRTGKLSVSALRRGGSGSAIRDAATAHPDPQLCQLSGAGCALLSGSRSQPGRE